MNVIKLFIKQQHGILVQECQSLTLHQGYGIESDIHAQPGSPRQVLITSTSTLDEFGLNPGDLGENLLIDTQVENFSSGKVLRIGKEALIRLTFLCEPCAYLNKIHPDLAKKIKEKRGFLGIVVQNGTIEINDEVSLTHEQFPVISNDAKGRFSEFVRRIPQGRVVKTPDLLIAMGVSKAYYRAIPAFLKKAQASVPTHRIVCADGSLMSKYVPQQEQLLREEGIEVVSNRVADDKYYWNSRSFHQLSSMPEKPCSSADQ